MDFPPKVVASVTSIEEAKDAKKLGTDIIEVRVDLLHGDALSAVESIFSLGVPLIITVRPEYEGGRFKGSDRERVEIFGSLAQYAAFIDVELKARTLDDIISTTKGTDALPIVSYHNFKKTPSNAEMLRALDRCAGKGGIAKLAVMPHSLYDVLRLYEVTIKAKRPCCTIAMGMLGKHSRIMAPVYGSVLTYGYVKKPVAPGQMRVDKIIEGLHLLGLR